MPNQRLGSFLQRTSFLLRPPNQFSQGSVRALARLWQSSNPVPQYLPTSSEPQRSPVRLSRQKTAIPPPSLFAHPVWQANRWRRRWPAAHGLSPCSTGNLRRRESCGSHRRACPTRKVFCERGEGTPTCLPKESLSAAKCGQSEKGNRPYRFRRVPPRVKLA